MVRGYTRRLISNSPRLARTEACAFPGCGGRFKNKSGLRTHYTRMHDGKRPSESHNRRPSLDQNDPGYLNHHGGVEATEANVDVELSFALANMSLDGTQDQSAVRILYLSYLSLSYLSIYWHQDIFCDDRLDGTNDELDFDDGPSFSLANMSLDATEGHEEFHHDFASRSNTGSSRTKSRSASPTQRSAAREHHPHMTGEFCSLTLASSTCLLLN